MSLSFIFNCYPQMNYRFSKLVSKCYASSVLNMKHHILRSYFSNKLIFGMDKSYLHQPYLISFATRLSVSTSSKLFKDDNFKNENLSNTFDPYIEDIDSSTEYEDIAKRCFSSPTDGHQVIVVQPYIKWGQKKNLRTTPDLQLSEAVCLVDSIQNWNVIDKIKVPLENYDKKLLFGSGALQTLKDKIKSNGYVTAVFISLNLLKGYQQRELEEAFGVPVFDRYNIIMQIFRERAVTREAKLQVALAEIPYLWSKIENMYEGESSRQGYGGPGESYVEIRRRILANREHKLKFAIEKLRAHRELLRSKRKKHDYPTVAVVGYTNAGKTSLIKALTGEEKLQPKDQLFATLDVTTHAGILPSNLKVLYIDTVGFIADIPTNLIESFNATLEDALLADIIVHVCDISHPDVHAQSLHVTETLRRFNISPKLKDSVLTVWNKIDLIKGKEKLPRNEDAVFVSSVTETGIDILKEKIEESILKATGRRKMIFRVPMGGIESRWLYKETAVISVQACPENNQYLMMTVIITPTCLGKFQHSFVRKK